MTKEIKDSGRFIFNKDTPLLYRRQGQLIPGKPDNMETDGNQSESFTPDGLYTYSIGISEIQANNVNYDESNAFVTKPIELNENVLEVVLDSIEEHPVFEEVSGRAASQQTSVEYYLSLKKRPGLNDWHPILPRQTKKVKGERLFFEGISATTLFSFQMNSIVVYKDGVKLDKSMYYILNKQAIQIDYVDSDSVYTVDYSPDTFTKDPYTFEVNDFKFQTERIVEEFPEGTDINKTITLRHVPYIDKERLLQEEDYNPNTSDYRPIDVSIVQANIQIPNGGATNYVPPTKEIEDRPYMVNKSLYLDNSWSEMEHFDLEKGYLGIDYFQHKNKITLAEHINVPMIEENMTETPGTGTIRVSYDALVTAFRLKIVLRRNTKKEKTASPRVKEFTLNFKATR